MEGREGVLTDEGRHASQRSALLSSAHRRGRDEDADVLPVEAASLPLLASVVPEGLPLGGHVAVTGGNPDEEGVIFLELVGGDDGDGFALARGAHLGEDVLWESLLDLVQVGFAAGGFDAGLLGFGELLDVPVHRVLGRSGSA